jgi:hypothetical protein
VPLSEEPELVCVGVVVVGVVVTGGGVVDVGGGGVVLVGGGGGGGGADPVPAYADMVSTEPTANSRNDVPTNPKTPLVFIYPRMSVRPGRRCTTSYYEHSEPTMSCPGRLGSASRNLPLFEDASCYLHRAYRRPGLLKTAPAAILCVRAAACRPVRFHSLREGRTLAL